MRNQGLTTEQIEAMKEANLGGEAIVNALLANSETFEAKTEFSQVQVHSASNSQQPVRHCLEQNLQFSCTCCDPERPFGMST